MLAAGPGRRPVREQCVPELCEDAALVSAARDGDRAAFGRLYDRYARMVHGVLLTRAAEAHAMLKTWRDSWFEEGSRLIYIVPRGFIDKVLPLGIDPEPGKIERVFVGRLEIITPATARTIETALASNDKVTL